MAFRALGYAETDGVSVRLVGGKAVVRGGEEAKERHLDRLREYRSEILDLIRLLGRRDEICGLLGRCEALGAEILVQDGRLIVVNCNLLSSELNREVEDKRKDVALWIDVMERW